jgi:hypothetical protein
MALTDLFISTFHNNRTHNWILNSHNSQIGTIENLAYALSTEIVRFRCRRCSQHFDSWRNKAENNIPLNKAAKNALRAFLVPTFGDPDHNDMIPNIDHLEGFVGEWLWYFLITENPTEPIIHIIPPGFKSTDPGGDALIIHRVINDELHFRLWEMKKFAPRATDSKQRLGTTVDKAYSQLNTNALEYLARITATEQELDCPELENFIGLLPDLWIDASPQAAAGISIATSLSHMSYNCFDDFGQQFPTFTNPIRLLGMLTCIGDFSAFTVKVKEYVWKGL